MKQIYTPLEFDNAKYCDKLPLECKECNKVFYKTKADIKTFLNKKSTGTYEYCSLKCSSANIHNRKTIKTICEHCGASICKVLSEYKKNKHHFCSLSCSASYHNTHKKYGCNRSKLEKWLEEQLTKLYPKLEFHFNRKDTIKSELDIYIPSLQLAFELNGIFHYEPIFGSSHLSNTQNNDKRKYQACLEQKIDLCIIDTSQQKNFKEHKSLIYLDIIRNIIDARI